MARTTPTGPKALRLPLCVFLGGVLLGEVAWGQLDLPRERPSPEATGPELPRRERGDVAPEAGPRRKRLELPAATAQPAPPPPAPVPLSELYAPDPVGAARFVLDGAAGLRDPDSPAAVQAVEHLASLGAPALELARAGLAEERPVPLIVCARVLLRAGGPEERGAVAARLRSDMPRGVGALLLKELAASDPVLASPEFFTTLLDHPQGSVREAAERALRPRAVAATIPALSEVLRSQRADTRIRILGLVGPIEHVSALHLLASRLADPVARVAGLAAELLAGRRDPEAVDLLRERALAGSGALDRGSAFALLALIEREDATGETLLDETDVPRLLSGLGSTEPAVQGACAAALAGVGFRSPRSRDMAWLDREVPHLLVRLSSGAEFYRDFVPVRRQAERRLVQVTGRTFGGDGPAWMRWWAEAAEGFRARRAVIDVRDGEERTLELALHEGGRTLWLAGPDAPGRPDVASSTYWIEEGACAGLEALLEREGVLDARLSSGPAPRAGRGGRVLEVTVAGQGKRFELADGREEPWFERVADAVRAQVEAVRWLDYPDPDGDGTRRERWERGRAAWRGLAAEERARRLKDAVLRALPVLEGEARGAGIAELRRLYARGDVASPLDFPALLEVLAGEPAHGERVETLVGLALAAARSADEGAVDPELGRQLSGVLLDRFGLSAEPSLVRVLESAGFELLVSAAADERPVLRATAARALGTSREPTARARLLALLDDDDERVERAAVRALGAARAEEGRDELAVRARLAGSAVRGEALRALARLGGPEAHDALVLGLAADEPLVALAAAEGLAELADAETAPLLVSLLSRGSGSPLFGAARAGLARIGAPAHPHLLRLTASAAPRTRREAALVLSEQGVAEAASVLIAVLTDDPDDGRVAAELAVLTGVDLRAAADPAQAWWNWWDLVVHDDSLAWLCGAAERAGHEAPEPQTLRGGGTSRGAAFLLTLLGAAEPHLAERARRELGRLLDRELEEPPGRGELWDAWLRDLADEVAGAFGPDGNER